MSGFSIALTAGTSFTATWIAKAFAEKGWTVHALCSQAQSRYAGIRAARLRLLRDVAQVHYEVPVENQKMADWIRSFKPNLWIHHHHFMEHFRSPDYDLARAREVGLSPLPHLATALRVAGCQGILYSGSYFEPGEGGEGNHSPSPYACSKKEVGEALRELCKVHQIPFSKIVIPNPVGPLENEDRLTSVMVAKAKSGQSIQIASRASKSDNVPVFSIAEEYVRLAGSLMAKPCELVSRPSGWVTDPFEWAEIVNRELITKRLGLPAVDIQLKPPGAPNADLPNSHRNPPAERLTIDWPQFWDRYAWEIKTDQ